MGKTPAPRSRCNWCHREGIVRDRHTDWLMPHKTLRDGKTPCDGGGRHYTSTPPERPAA